MSTVNLLSASAVANLLGISDGYARYLCREHGIGQAVSGRVRVLEPDDVERLRLILDQAAEKNVGRPRKKT